MGVDLLDVLQLGALFGQQIVVHLQPGGADDLKAAVAEHQVIDLLDGAGGAVFQRQHTVVAEAVLDGGKDALEAAEVHHLGGLEHLLTGQLGIRALHALAGDHRLGREEVGGALHGALDLLAQGGGLGVHRVLVPPADLKEHGPQGIAVLRQFRGSLAAMSASFSRSRAGVQGGQALGLLLLGHLGHHLHPLEEGLDQGGRQCRRFFALSSSKFISRCSFSAVLAMRRIRQWPPLPQAGHRPGTMQGSWRPWITKVVFSPGQGHALLGLADGRGGLKGRPEDEGHPIGDAPRMPPAWLVRVRTWPASSK